MTSLSGRITAGVLSVAALSLPLSVTTATSADAASYHYKNCTALHEAFKHGVGLSTAEDRHSKSSKAVTSFKKSTKIYRAAIKFNRRLDADKDGIACEQH